MSRAPPYSQMPGSPASSTTNLIPPSASPSRRGPPSIRSLGSTNSPYDAATDRRPPSLKPSVAEKFSLSPDPQDWGAAVALTVSEPDDYLHNPDPKRDRKNDKGGTFLTARGFANLGCLAILLVALVGLFAGYPVASHFITHSVSTNGGFNLGGTNASGQVPSMPGNWGMIDLETPQDAYTYTSFYDNSEMQLIFSDEFNTDGRTFYPGDDPYWEAVDLHYWQTNNLEWYSPEAITTKNGSLVITLSKKVNHGLNYQGGMMSTWNKFCFTGGLVLASVNLPGANNVLGLWPAIWTMGNLGRAGYGASLDGMWPYTYDACDVGTAPNQTLNGLPLAATENGDPSYGDVLSYLPGQRLSRCTCAGESHPGPIHSDGTYVGRSAPEIDIFEAQVSNSKGFVSQSGQWAPFNHEYVWENTTDNLIIYNSSVTILNSYLGGVYQQATSCVSQTAQNCYQLNGTCFATYGLEYKPGFDDAYITWINNGKAAWSLNVAGVGADSEVEISARPIPQEPLYLLANLGISENFGYVDFDHLKFPALMTVDYIRVYQRSDSINVGCDPEDFPTAAYINEYMEAYTNPNLTTWVNDYKQALPKSSFLGQC
ncbi:glycoside hydrolase family 16 protein [Lentinula guzmanii]|uniref:Glycoside hydrolase family 16 protein n=1 Tax=Lentinula guzmanii TaxID=2804957 RepID=A0AA38K0S4_9AGAR|nr:glycoside hydrolase family 16 protein [Lentinula guzmanii]